MVMVGSDGGVDRGRRVEWTRAKIGVSACLTLTVQPKSAGSNSSVCMQFKLPIHNETLLLQLAPFFQKRQELS